MIDVKGSKVMQSLNALAMDIDFKDAAIISLDANSIHFRLNDLVENSIETILKSTPISELTAIDAVLLPFIKKLFIYNLYLEVAQNVTGDDIDRRLASSAGDAGYVLVKQLKEHQWVIGNVTDILSLSDLLYLHGSQIEQSSTAPVFGIYLDLSRAPGQGGGIDEFNEWVCSKFKETNHYISEEKFMERVWRGLMYFEPNTFSYLLLPSSRTDAFAVEALKTACNKLSIELAKTNDEGRFLPLITNRQVLRTCLKAFAHEVKDNLKASESINQIFYILEDAEVDLYKAFVNVFASEYNKDGSPYLLNKDQLISRPDFALVLMKDLIDSNRGVPIEIELLLLENGMNLLKLCSQFPNILDYRGDNCEFTLSDMKLFIELLPNAIPIAPNDATEIKINKYAERYYELTNKERYKGYVITRSEMKDCLDNIASLTKVFVKEKINSEGSFNPKYFKELFKFYNDEVKNVTSLAAPIEVQIELDTLFEEILKNTMNKNLDDIAIEHSDIEHDSFKPY